MHVRVRLAAIVLAGVALSGVTASAQILPATPDVTGARVRVGPLWMNPSLSLTDVGVDTNIFNDADEQNPKRDVAMAVVPQSDFWMRFGRTWLTGNARQDLLWFRDYRDERSANAQYRAGWLVPLTRVSLLIDGAWLRAKERPGLEIDARAERREGAASGALEVRALSRTLLGGRLERRDIRFASTAVFGGQRLQEQLNRVRTTAAATLRHEATPMTSLVAEATVFTDRFTYSPDRDADSTQMSGGLRFDPAALIKGSVFVGYRKFSPASPDVPAFTGTTLNADVSYVAPTSTRFAVQGVRDVEYSFENSQPYYLITGVSGSLTQRILGPLDVQGRGGVRTLAYRNRIAALDAPPDRRDRVVTVGGGFGYRVGHDLRVSLDVEHHRRTSIVSQRNYDGIRYGVSVSWGL